MMSARWLQWTLTVVIAVCVALFGSQMRAAAALRSFFVLSQGPQRPHANLLMTVGMGVSFAALTF